MEPKKERLMDSTIYKRIFEFIKKEGYEPFLHLVNDLDNTKEEDKDTIIEKGFIQRNNILSKLNRRNKLVYDFMYQFKNGFLSKITINSQEFIDFIRNVSLSLESPQKYFESLIAKKEIYSSEEFDSSRYTLDHYLENAELLEKAKIGVVKIYPGLSTRHFSYSPNIPYGQTVEIARDENGNITAMTKVYSDKSIVYEARGKIEDGSNFECYAFGISSPSYVVVGKSRINYGTSRIAYINDYGFNNVNMPDDADLSKNDLTKTLKKYRDDYMESEDLPF